MSFLDDMCVNVRRLKALAWVPRGHWYRLPMIGVLPIGVLPKKNILLEV